MNTLQIERLLKKGLKSKTIFKKVCALDQLEKPTFPSAYVINSDPSSEPGEHWVAVYFDKRGRGEYFDSYGLGVGIHVRVETDQCTVKIKQKYDKNKG